MAVIYLIPHRAQSLEYNRNHFTVCATNGKLIKSKALLIATGAAYRKLPIDNVQDFEGCGIYYSATGMDISNCANQDVVIVGGGNSAGQAAMFLSKTAKRVHVIIRGDHLGAKMSDYLVQRINASEVIDVHINTEVTNLFGDHHLEKITLTTNKTEKSELETSNLFSFIGAAPNTVWLNDIVVTDKKGFICTGELLIKENLTDCDIYKKREPQSLEASIPGIFAVGDVRKGSVKRVASAVGEGSMAVSQIHTFLSEL